MPGILMNARVKPLAPLKAQRPPQVNQTSPLYSALLGQFFPGSSADHSQGSTVSLPTVAAPSAPPTAPPAPTPKIQAPSGTGGLPSTVDFDSDPILQQIKAANTKNIADAQASANSQTYNSLLGFGSQELARKVLGNDPRISAISDNPDTSLSLLAQLSRGYREGVHQSDEQDNQANLFYSGARVKHLGDLAHQNEANVANATATEQNSLDTINQNLLNVQQSAQDRWLQALSEAYARLLAMGAGAPTGPGGPPPVSQQTSNSALTNLPQAPGPALQQLHQAAVAGTVSPALYQYLLQGRKLEFD